MKWLKYKHKWAYGDNDPEYIEIPDEYIVDGELNEDFIEDYQLIDLYKGYSDRYRGIDYNIVDYPPRDVIVGLIGRARARIVNAESDLERYIALIDEVDGK